MTIGMMMEWRKTIARTEARFVILRRIPLALYYCREARKRYQEMGVRNLPLSCKAGNRRITHLIAHQWQSRTSPTPLGGYQVRADHNDILVDERASIVRKLMTKIVLGTAYLIFREFLKDSTDTAKIEILVAVDEMHMDDLDGSFFSLFFIHIIKFLQIYQIPVIYEHFWLLFKKIKRLFDPTRQLSDDKMTDVSSSLRISIVLPQQSKRYRRITFFTPCFLAKVEKLYSNTKDILKYLHQKSGSLPHFVKYNKMGIPDFLLDIPWLMGTASLLKKARKMTKQWYVIPISSFT